MSTLKNAKYVDPSEVYKYLTQERGLSHNHAVGMITNIKYESGFNAAAVGDNGNSIGLFQHNTSRMNALKNYAGDDWTNWKKQIDYALTEKDTKRYLSQEFNTPENASIWFTLNWERPTNKEQKAQTRAMSANTFHTKFTTGETPKKRYWDSEDSETIQDEFTSQEAEPEEKPLEQVLAEEVEKIDHLETEIKESPEMQTIEKKKEFLQQAAPEVLEGAHVYAYEEQQPLPPPQETPFQLDPAMLQASMPSLPKLFVTDMAELEQQSFQQGGMFFQDGGKKTMTKEEYEKRKAAYERTTGRPFDPNEAPRQTPPPQNPQPRPAVNTPPPATRDDSLRVYTGAVANQEFFTNPALGYKREVSAHSPRRVVDYRQDVTNYRTGQNGQGAAEIQTNVQQHRTNPQRIVKEYPEWAKITGATPATVQQAGTDANTELRSADNTTFPVYDYVTGAMDFTAPPVLFDTRITPQGDVTYTPGSIQTPSALVELPYYDPIAVSPSDLLSDEDFLKRFEMYGTSGLDMDRLRSLNPNVPPPGFNVYKDAQGNPLDPSKYGFAISNEPYTLSQNISVSSLAKQNEMYQTIGASPWATEGKRIISIDKQQLKPLFTEVSAEKERDALAEQLGIPTDQLEIVKIPPKLGRGYVIVQNLDNKKPTMRFGGTVSDSLTYLTSLPPLFHNNFE